MRERLVLGLALAVVVSACNGESADTTTTTSGDTTTTAAQPTTTAAAPTTTAPPATTTTTTLPVPDIDALEDGLLALLEDYSHRNVVRPHFPSASMHECGLVDLHGTSDSGQMTVPTEDNSIIVIAGNPGEIGHQFGVVTEPRDGLMEDLESLADCDEEFETENEEQGWALSGVATTESGNVAGVPGVILVRSGTYVFDDNRDDMETASRMFTSVVNDVLIRVIAQYQGEEPVSEAEVESVLEQDVATLLDMLWPQ